MTDCGYPREGIEAPKCTAGVRVLKLTIAYDGTRYHGWQAQAGTKHATIQNILQQALSKILHEPVNIVGSGRTDSGVHAQGQVAHVRMKNCMLPRILQRALDSLLPRDISVIRISRVGNNFHAQFSAQRKRYRYRLVGAARPSPFAQRYVHRVGRPLRVPAMRAAACHLIGTHDMAPFQVMGSPVKDTYRRITDVRVQQQEGEIWIDIEANGFLYKMVRRIVGTLIQVGVGKQTPRVIHEILSTGEAGLVGPTAPACGLSLLSVKY
jgi:tRNA pseudouridine38-40 synthase